MIIISSDGKTAIDSTNKMFRIRGNYVLVSNITNPNGEAILLAEYPTQEQAQLAFDFLLMAFKNQKPTYRLMKADCCASEAKE